MRRCPDCGAPVELVHLAQTGQRMLVNPGSVPVYVGPDSAGMISHGRVMHFQTCPAQSGMRYGDEFVKVVRDGAWEQPEVKAKPRKGAGRKGRR